MPVLKTLWSSEGEEYLTPIWTPDEQFASQVSVSFHRRKPLWVVNQDRKPLRKSRAYVDLWSNETDLPLYQEPINRDLSTSIVVPLLHWGRAIGVIYLETVSYLEITEVAKEELRLLADALAILYDLQQANRAQTTGTQDAISELNDLLSATRFPQLTKPQIFIASSRRADEQVMAIIREVLDEYSDRLNVVAWNRIEDSGSITIQIVEEIAKSRFGMCYFSEPVKDAEHRFQDNPNVLFEAGMLHSLTNSPDERPSGWIPIREKESPQVPFDFATERMEIVPRTGSGEVIEERLRTSLRGRMDRLLRNSVF
jgi:Predicted nucleotide-binding protein containing TIR-like domain